MSESQPTEPLASALEALELAHREAVAAVEAAESPRRALELASAYFGAVQAARKRAAGLRSETAARIWKAEELSLAGLAKIAGVSRGRAGQLVRAAGARKGEP
jgi:hypothetical protein